MYYSEDKMTTVEKFALALFILSLFGASDHDGFSTAGVIVAVITGFIFITNGGVK